ERRPPYQKRSGVRHPRAGRQSLQPRRGRIRLPRKGHAEMPLPVEAIQVDGGSEFNAEFEQACQANEQLLVLVELVTPRSIDPRTVPSISAITTGPTASSPDKPRPVTTKRAQQSMPPSSQMC